MRWLLLVCVLWAAPAQACRLALVLGLDVSSSVDAREYQIQTQGLATALNSPKVRDEIFAFPDAPVALYAFEWSGRFDQVTLVPWTLLRSPADLQKVITQLRLAERSFSNRPTALGHALGHALRAFNQGPSCQKRTVDISGDGYNNDGIAPTRLYEMTPLGDITVNGLPIGDGEIANYYHRRIIQGPGAFVEWARGFEDFERAMRAKLERELRPATLSALSPNQAKRQPH
ncbi:MAG: DUF1194 domain-containing protein [Pseudomonadota bacterium]